MAVGGGVAEIGGREALVGELGDAPLRLDLRLGVGGEGIERVVLVEIELLALAVHRAGTGEEVAPDAGRLGDLGETDGSLEVDRVGEVGIQIPHRVVGDRGQVHHAVVALEVLLVEGADVLDEFAVRAGERLPLAALEEIQVTAR